MSAEEVRVVSATGGEKGSKPAQLGTIDPLALLGLAEVGGFGAEKYAAFNYLKGYDWDLSWNAMQRHALAFWAGEDRDDESGLLHVLHAAWHCLAMASFQIRNLGTDTRFVQEQLFEVEPASPIGDFAWGPVEDQLREALAEDEQFPILFGKAGDA